MKAMLKNIKKRWSLNFRYQMAKCLSLWCKDSYLTHTASQKSIFAVHGGSAVHRWALVTAHFWNADKAKHLILHLCRHRYTDMHAYLLNTHYNPAASVWEGVQPQFITACTTTTPKNLPQKHWLFKNVHKKRVKFMHLAWRITQLLKYNINSLY